jgi:hypothetical protein
MGPFSVVERITSLVLTTHPRVVQLAENCAVWRCEEDGHV